MHAADDTERATAAKANGDSKSSKATYDFDISDADSAISSSPAKPSHLFYRPNPAALFHQFNPLTTPKLSTFHPSSIYKLSCITPTLIPQHPPLAGESNLLDEYISSELSSTPLTEPSISLNSTIPDRRRGSLNARQREKEKKRTEYKERNLARLPGESKVEKRKTRARGEGVVRVRRGTYMVVNSFRSWGR